jgi:hypothetical protein
MIQERELIEMRPDTLPNVSAYPCQLSFCAPPAVTTRPANLGGVTFPLSTGRRSWRDVSFL